MALDIGTGNINISPVNVKPVTDYKPQKDIADRGINPADADTKRPVADTAAADAAGKAVEVMREADEKEPVEFAPAETKKTEEDNLAIRETSENGDELSVTNEGAASAQAGGTVLASEEDGLVAEQNKVSIEANQEAMEQMRAQIQETRQNQARAMEQMKATAEANTERARERNDLRDAENEAAKARKDVLIEEANTSGNTVVEAQKEHVDNLNGLTEDQVEQLYRDGRITRYEYQQNMESREAAEEAVAANGQQNAELVKETLANEEVVAASQAMITAVDNGNAAVMEAALGINPTDGQQQIQIQAVVR